METEEKLETTIEALRRLVTAVTLLTEDFQDLKRDLWTLDERLDGLERKVVDD